MKFNLQVTLPFFKKGEEIMKTWKIIVIALAVLAVVGVSACIPALGSGASGGLQSCVHEAVTDPAVPATCNATGLTAGSHCKKCNAVIVRQETIPVIPHTPEIIPAVPATAERDGLTEGSICGMCGEVLVPQVRTTFTGYTVTFESETILLDGEGDLQYGENYGIPIMLTKKDGTTEEIETGEERTVENVVTMYIPALDESVELEYTMGGIRNVLYNYGSHNPSETVELTGDVSISAKWYYQNCILADSLVTMADGSRKALGDIVAGDEILSYDWETGELISNPVIYASSQDDSRKWTTIRYFVWTFSDGTVIKSAFAHRFYNAEQKKFVHLEFWNIGDRIYKEDGTFAALVSKETVYEECTYGRITGLYGTNYFANGALTGDSECPENITFGED